MWNERRRRERERLGGRRHFAGHIAGRYRTLLDRKHRLAGIAVENVEKACFVALNDDRDFFTVTLDSGQQRRRGAVVVPKVVMDELKSPSEFAGLRAQGDNRISPLV